MPVPSSRVCRYGPNVPASLSPTMNTVAGSVGRRRAGVHRFGVDRLGAASQRRHSAVLASEPWRRRRSSSPAVASSPLPLSFAPSASATPSSPRRAVRRPRGTATNANEDHDDERAESTQCVAPAAVSATRGRGRGHGTPRIRESAVADGGSPRACVNARCPPGHMRKSVRYQRVACRRVNTTRRRSVGSHHEPNNSS